MKRPLLLSALLLGLVACDQGSKTGDAPAKAADQAVDTAKADDEDDEKEAASPKSKVRDGKWEASSPGRGVAYTVESKGGVVTLNMGGTVFEGRAHEGGRRYQTKSSKYLVVPTADGFELKTPDKPTWRVTLSDGSIGLKSDGKEVSLVKAGDTFEIKRADKSIGKVRTKGDKVEVTDGSDKLKWGGTDGLVAAWGVLLMTDIGQPMRRLLFTELLARGR